MLDRLGQFMNLLQKGAYWVNKRTVGPLALRNYDTAKAYHHYRLTYLDSQTAGLPLLIYQMGKVGSTTVEHALRQSNIDRRIYHIHYLTPEWLKTYEQKRRQEYNKRASNRFTEVWTAQYVSKLVKKPLQNGEKWQVITLVRDPVARNISSFFQLITMDHLAGENKYRLKSDDYEFDLTVTNHDLDQLMKIFFERGRHDTPLTFFDRELKTMLNLDVFSCRFPIKQGYKIYETDQVRLLLIRLENLNACASQALRDFLNIEVATLEKTNVGVKKDYADAYQHFKRSIAIPDAYLDTMYNSKYARHFYSQAEIAQFRATWSR